MRVRLFQKRSEGPFFREVHIPGQGRDQAALHTRDRDAARQLGQQLLAELLAAGGGARALHAPAGPVRLSELWERYRSECPDFLDNTARTRANATSRAPILVGFFGAARDVRTITRADLTRYANARRAGGVVYSNGRTTSAVRQRSVHADLALLRAMLRWACTVLDASGRPWLERNPLEGVRFEQEHNPRRPVATYEQFNLTRKALAKLVAAAGTNRERERWLRLDMALVLAEATGRRRGAIVALRWEDINFDNARIRWRAENDKKRMESVVPVPSALVDELRCFRTKLGAVSGWLFPRMRNPAEPIPPEMLSQDLVRAERAAGIPKLRGGLWHAYRRKWASERMHLPVKAVADAGGWKDTATLMTSYQHADEATLLEVMSEPRKRHELHTSAAEFASP